jgi:hypothetical protein
MQIAVTGVADKADDAIDQVGLSPGSPLFEDFADGVRAGEKAPRELLVDDGTSGEVGLSFSLKSRPAIMDICSV